MIKPVRGFRVSHFRVAAVVTTGITVVALSAAPSQAALASRSLSFAAPASTIVGSAITVTGKVTHSPKGSLVVIKRKSGRTWVIVSRAHTTTAAGNYSSHFTVPKTRGTYTYQAIAPGSRTLAKALSRTRSVIVRVRSTATLATSSKTAAVGQKVTLSGKVTPWSTHRSATLYRRVLPATGWSKYLTLHPGSTGSWSASVVPAAHAITQYRVTVPTYGYDASATSPTVAVATPALIANKYVDDGTVGSHYSTTLATTDHRAGTWTVSSGALPLGVTLSPKTGVLSGSPTKAQKSVTFTITFTDAYGLTATKTFTMAVDVTAIPTGTVQLAAGGVHTCRITATAALQCWGDNSKGEVGVGSDPISHPTYTTPQTVDVGSQWLQVSASPSDVADDTCAIRVDRSLWCWGYDANGEAGQGNRTEYNSPKQVLPGTHWTDVAVGGTFTCAVRTDGTLWCWGAIGNSTEASAPAQVGTAANWSTVVAGYGHACALDSTGFLWCWGSNFRGWLGNGTLNAAAAPTKIGTKKWISIAAGPGNTCGVQSNGSLWCWGANSDGQLGNGTIDPASSTTMDKDVPTQVGTSKNWQSVSVNGAGNYNHVCAVDQSLSIIECWGSNANGEVGVTPATPFYYDTPHAANTPTAVWVSVAAGGVHSCGTTAGGVTYCWGSNDNGQIGVTSATTPAAPTLVP